MNQTETHALYARAEAARTEAKAAGQDDEAAHAAATAVWNAWAEGMLAQRKALEAAGTWAASKDALGSFEGHNDETRAWIASATTVFSTFDSKHAFEHPVDCSNWTFPSNAQFDGAEFAAVAPDDGVIVRRSARFDEAMFSGTAGFDAAIFKSSAWFVGATFTGVAGFYGSKFEGDAWFERTTFASAARFEGTTFARETHFGAATFTRNAWFGGATFGGETWFEGVNFTGYAGFGGATFMGHARFGLAKFSGYTTFANAIFHRYASFNAIKGESAFTLERARFRLVPDFIQANFVQAPRLDNITLRKVWVPKQGSLFMWPLRAGQILLRRSRLPDISSPARYRSLKRLAIQGHDLEREQMFHAGEIRSARFATDWPIHWNPASIWRFWFGLVYEILSDFGRSVMRPAIAWALLLVASAAIYLGASPDVSRERAKLLTDASASTLVVAYAETTLAAWHRNQRCVETGAGVQGLPDAVRNVTSAINEALHLSFANGAVLGDVGSPDTGTRTYGCLYGLAPTSGDARLSIVPYPGIVATMSKIQRFLSALLIFLFGLAVRNMLKMK